MKRTNKVIAMILAVITVLSAMTIVPITASAKETTVVSTSASNSGKCGKTATWKLDSKGVLTITGSGSVTSTSGIDQLKVKEIRIQGKISSIKEYAFFCFEKVKKIIVGNSVKTIGNRAFDFCDSLTYLKIGDSVTSFDIFSLSGNNNIKTIVIGAKAKVSFPSDLYYYNGLKKLSHVAISRHNKNYKSIDGVVYSKNGNKLLYYPGAKNGTSYNIPKGVKTIEGLAFQSATKLKKVTIPNTVTNIKRLAFINCNNLKNVKIPKSVKKIGELAFGFYSKDIINSADDGETILYWVKGFSISGYKATAAERYAFNYKIKFKKL